MKQLDRLEAKLDALAYAVRYLIHRSHAMSGYFDDLQAQVALTTSIEASALALIQGLAAKLEAAAGDPAQLAVIVQQLKASGDGLAAAILANTPSAPATTEPAANPGEAGTGAGGAQG